MPSEDHDAQTDRLESPLRDPLQERNADDLPKKCGGYKGEGERDVPPVYEAPQKKNGEAAEAQKEELEGTRAAKGTLKEAAGGKK